MSSLQAFIDYATPITLAAVVVMLIVNWIALLRAARRAKELRAISADLHARLAALQQKMLGLELSYSDLGDAVEDLMRRPTPAKINGADACDAPADEEEMPF